MKKIYRYLIFAATAFISSCNFLEELPTTSLVEENILSSEESAYSALKGCYKSLSCYEESAFLAFIHSSSIFAYHNQTTQLDSWFNHTMYSTDDRVQTAYSKIYSSISTINTFIRGLNDSAVPESLRKVYEAEARFLRAFDYFYAVRLWGDVPLILEQPSTPEEASVGRTPYQKVYKAILEDLTYAEENLLDWNTLGETGRDYGRVCNYAATALKAKVYLQIACYMEYPEDQWFDLNKEGRYPDFTECGIGKDDFRQAYTKALECAKDVIDNGPYALEPDFANLFRWDPANHPENYRSRERILVISNTSMSGGSAYSTWSLPQKPWGGLEIASQNGNKVRVRPNRFIWQKWCEKYGGEEFRVEKSQDDIGEIVFYKGCPDPRLDATYYYNKYFTGSPGDEPTTVKCYPYYNTADDNRVCWKSTTNFGDSQTAANMQAYPIFKKGFSTTYAGVGSTGSADVYLMRYADVILIAAEAEAGLCSGTADKHAGNAASYVNMILSRARKSTNNNENYPHAFGDTEDAVSPHDMKASDFPTREDLILAIVMERCFEMEYEQQAFFDTRRRGASFYVRNFVEPFNEFMQEPANIRHLNGLFRGRLRQADIQNVRKGLLIAFPDRELRYNTALGYNAQNDFFFE